MSRVSLNVTYFLGLQGINRSLTLAFVRVPPFSAKIYKTNPTGKESFVLIRSLIELRTRV